MNELPFDTVNKRHFSTEERELKINSRILDKVAEIDEVKADLLTTKRCVADNAGEISDLKNDKQDKLIAGENIIIENNVISSTGGGHGTIDYSELENKPKINGVELIGDKASEYLNIDYKDLKNVPEKAEAMYYDAEGTLDPEGNSYWYMSGNKEEPSTNIISGPYNFGTGGGGGGSGASEVNIEAIDWPTTVQLGATCEITINWTSIKREKPTGNGTILVYINNNLKLTKKNTPQGLVTIDIKNLLEDGTNTVEVRALDAYGTVDKVIQEINAVNINITSSFNENRIFTGDINYTYTPNGNVDKTVHFIMDGFEVASTVVRTSGDSQTQIFPRMAHGVHRLEVYFTCFIDGNLVESNHLVYELICYVEGHNEPIIASTFDKFEQEQFISFIIPYRVFTPEHNTSEIKLIVNNTIIQTLIVNQDVQYWEYKPTEAGDFEFKIICDDVQKVFSINVKEAEIDIQPVKENLALALNTIGRSNAEEHPEIWEDKEHNISCTLSNFNFASDGWVQDKEGNTVLRVTGNARVDIPYQIFSKDFRSSGKTIEIEFATSEVRNYESYIMSCFSGNRGFYLTSQLGLIKSLQSELQTQYKEDEHVRLTFVVEKNVETHLILMYINGVMSGAVQYPLDDNFRQLDPVNISIGSNDATIDIYNIRIYDNNLNRKQVVNNWIADTQVASLKKERYIHNDNYNDSGEIVVNKLPSDLPYMIYDIPELPTYKGDKRIANLITFIDPQNPEQSYTAEGAQMNVQGTSSQYYFRKNFKINHKGGFKQNGVVKKKYPIIPGAIEEKEFTYKADVASSEGANNVELVKYYQDTKPWKSPAEMINAACRVGIFGFPYVAFHNDGTKQYFYGKMNFNNDKGNKNTYGFETKYDEKYDEEGQLIECTYIDGDESWEMTNNNTDLDLFKSDDLSNWKDAFESRFPDDNTPDEHTFGENPGELDKLQEMVSWVYSTYRKETDSEEVKAAKLAKFKAELTDHFDLKSTLFYYLFTELFLMVDSRAKNAFPTYMRSRVDGDGGNRWFWFPYDMDTAIGINNEGLLVFNYNLEDTDKVDGAYVYNGQESVMWNNVRDAFGPELQSMYADLRSGNAGSDIAWTYDQIEKRYEEHQNKWSESIFNEDAYSKYLTPLIQSEDASYLGMLQGSKAEQRKWWLYNRFNYLDSKYKTGNALASTIMMRAYQKSDFHITPYADMYLTGNFDDQIVTIRAEKDNEYELKSPASWDPHGTDAVVSLYSANKLKDIGDISKFYVGYANFSAATKLQKIIVGSGEEGYSNEKLTEINVGANKMLQYLDVRNCPNLKQAVDLSGCSNIEEVYFDNTAVTGVTLPNGGILKKLHLPGTLTNLTIRNQKSLEDFVLAGTSNIQRLWLENIPSSVISAKAFITEMPNRSAVRLIGINETYTVDEIKEFYNIIDEKQLIGINAQGEDVDKPQLNGIINTGEISYADYVLLSAKYPDVKIVPSIIWCTVNFLNEGEVHNTQIVKKGDSASEPLVPHKVSTAQFYYDFENWDKEFDNIQTDIDINAIYSEHVQLYTIKFDPQTSYCDPIDDQIIEYNSLVTKPIAIIHVEEVELVGWFKEPECINQFIFNIPVTGPFVPDENDKPKPITLYAKWNDKNKPAVAIENIAYNKFKYTITDNVAVTAYAITKSESAPTPEEWVEITPSIQVVGEYEITEAGIYYVWGKDQTNNTGIGSVVAYSINRNVAEGAQLTITDSNELVDNFSLRGRELLIHADIDNHYENLKLLLNREEIPNDSIKCIDQDLQIIVTCDPKSYLVHFDMGGRGTAVEDQLIVYNNKVKEPANQFEEGYITEYWYTSNTFETKWDFDNDVITEETTLYVKWVIYVAPTEITINVEGGQEIICNFTQTKADGVRVDWGDESLPVTSPVVGNVSLSHTYDVEGSYVIRITCNAGSHYLGRDINNQVIMPITAVTNVVFAYNMPYTNNYAFKGAINIQSLELTDYMTEIAVGSFENCTGLTSLIIPNNIRIIRSQAFKGCSGIVGQQNISRNVVLIESEAFSGCSNVTKFNLPDELSSIGNYAFYNCSNLEEFSIPKALTTLNTGLLGSCTSLTNIDIPTTVNRLETSVFAACTNLEKVIIRNPNLVTGYTNFNSCPRLQTAGPIGGNYNLEFAWDTEIPASAFSCGYTQSYFTTIVLPNSISKIGEYAFQYCGRLTYINMPLNLQYIGNNAFERCSSLTTFEIPSSCTYIGQTIFAYCTGLQRVDIKTTLSTFKADTYLASWFYFCTQVVKLHIPSALRTPEDAKIAYGNCWNFYNDGLELEYFNDL